MSFRKERSRNYRDFLATKPELFGAAFPWAVNRGIFMTPGDEEQWTLSVQHTDADIDRYVEAVHRVLRVAGRLSEGEVRPRWAR